MAKMESIIKSEIQRLAKRELHSVFRPLRREVWGMRLKLSELVKRFTNLNRWAKEQARQAESTEVKLEAAPEEVKASRLTPERIRGLRKKLGISQRELGILAGVTVGAVASWENGKFKPKGEKKAALVALRRLRKRDAKKLLMKKAEEVAKKQVSKKAKPIVKKRRAAKKRK